MVVAKALGLVSVRASPPAAVTGPVPVPSPSDRWDERPHDQRERRSRHGREWHDRGGWSGWHDGIAWNGGDWGRERGDDYDTGSDDGNGRSRRPRSRRPRRTRDWSSCGSFRTGLEACAVAA